MNTIVLDDDTRRFIGDNLLGTHGAVMPISALADATGISRPTLRKWIGDDMRLWELTRHITDRQLWSIAMHTPDSRDSRFFVHALGYARRILDIRRHAASGELGEDLRLDELDRIRNANASR